MALKADSFLIFADGTADEVASAKEVLQTIQQPELSIYAEERPERVFAG
jgi:hypothetical protein